MTFVYGKREKPLLIFSNVERAKEKLTPKWFFSKENVRGLVPTLSGIYVKFVVLAQK